MTSSAVASSTFPAQDEASRTAPPGVPSGSPLFVAETARQDLLGRGAAAGLLAELLVHRHVETPLTVAVLGREGSGKSQVLDDTAARAAALGAAARESSPFLSRVVVVRVDAARRDAPAPLLVGVVLDALGAGYAGFAEDAIYAGSDPREAARLAGERLNGLRRTLDGERQLLDDIGARRAQLAHSVLFDAAGSRIDAFARANRGRIEARLRAFGFPTADPLLSYKELVRELSETPGSGSRLGLVLRSLWAFKGQGTLLFIALLLAVVGLAASVGADDPASVSHWASGFGDRFSVLADWAQGHLDLLRPVSQIAWAIAALALLWNVVRAAMFLGPVFRGVALLGADLEGRRRDLDGLLAHQTRRVDQLASEAEAAGRNAEAAERRIDARQRTGISDHGAALANTLFGLAPGPQAAAEAFFAKLAATMAADGAPSAPAPQRIVVVIDGLDRLAGPAAVAFLETAQRLLDRPGFATLMSLDRDQISAALGDTDPALAASRLERMVQLSYNLDAVPFDPAGVTQLLLERPGTTASVAPVAATRSALDRPLQPFEPGVLKALAPFTAATPRRLKRFINTYRVARADPLLKDAGPAALGMLAWALAIDGTGAGVELAAFERGVAEGKVTVDQATDFGRSFAAVLSAAGETVSISDARQGLAAARRYSRTG